MGDNFNDNQLLLLRNIFSSYCVLLSEFLSEHLGVSAKVELEEEEQRTFGEFIDSVSSPAILSIIEMRPLKEPIVFEMSAGIAYCIIDRISGGFGVEMQKMKGFTEIEQSLLFGVVNKMIEFIPEAWEDIEDFSPKVDMVETDPELVRIFKNDEPSALIRLSVKIKNAEGYILVCIPYVAVETLMNKPTKTNSVSVLSVDVGKTTISEKDFEELKIGDVIPLDSYIGSEMTVFVDGVSKFCAESGVSNGKNAVRITKIL